MNKSFLKGFFAGLLFWIIAIYSFFRIYWIMEVGLKYFRWHAILWLYGSIAAIFAGVSYWLYKHEKLNSQAAQKKYLRVFGLVAGLYLAELLLRLLGLGQTYSEQRFGVFVDPIERVQKTWYMRWLPHEKKVLESGNEFSFPRVANAEGFSDKEWTTQKDSNEIRIITLGDSFTEGDGAPADSCYPRQLEAMLQKEFPDVKINVLQAGRIGSDPWFEYKILHDLLLKYKPDIVVYTNGSNDLLFDHLYYGGMERFAPDSTVKNKLTKHWWMGLYEMSYVFRTLISATWYDNTLMSFGERQKNKVTAIADSKLLSKAYSQLAVENNFKCIQMVRADRDEIKSGKYEFDYSELISGTDSLPNYSSFNLLQFYKDSIQMSRKNVQRYFWHVDGHHNATGYKAMAKGVYKAVELEMDKKIIRPI